MLNEIVELYKTKSSQLQDGYFEALQVFEKFMRLPARKCWESIFSNAATNDIVLAHHFTRVSNEEMCGHQLLEFMGPHINDYKLCKNIEKHANDELRHSECLSKTFRSIFIKFERRYKNKKN